MFKHLVFAALILPIAARPQSAAGAVKPTAGIADAGRQAARDRWWLDASRKIARVASGMSYREPSGLRPSLGKGRDGAGDSAGSASVVPLIAAV